MPDNHRFHRDAVQELKERGTLQRYERAVKQVMDTHDQPLEAERVLRVLSGLVEMKGLDVEDVERAADLLKTDPEFRERIQYGGQLAAWDFASALENAPREGASYTPDEARRLRYRFGDEVADALKHVDYFEDGQKKIKYLPTQTNQSDE